MGPLLLRLFSLTNVALFVSRKPSRYPRQLSTCKEAGRGSWARVERGLDGAGAESGASLEGRRPSNCDGTLSQKEKKLKLQKRCGNLERAFRVSGREEIE